MQDDIPGDVSRRGVLKSTGAALGGGAVVAFGSSGTASASVSTSEIGIPPARHEGEDGSVSSLSLSVSGSYQYTTDGADQVIVTLSVASGPDKTDWGVLDQHEENALAASSAGPYSLSGNILSHDQLDAGEFSADPGGTVTREVPVRIVLDVTKGGEAVTTATATGVATIEVTSTAVAVSAEVSADGSVEVAV